MKIKFPLLWALLFAVIPQLINAQNFSFNWAHDLGNTGLGLLNIKNSCTNAQNHYFAVGRIAGTINFARPPQIHLVNGNNNSISTRYAAFFAEYDSSFQLVRAVAVSPLIYKVSFDAVEVDANGDIIIAGTMADSAYLDPANPFAVTNVVGGDGNDFFLAKYNASMQLQWVKTFPNPGTANPMNLKVDQQNNILLAGEFNNVMDIDPSAAVYPLASYNGGNASNDAFLSKFDPNGNLLWAKNLGSSSIDVLGDIDVDPNNNVYIGVSYEGTTAFIDSNVVVNAATDNFIGVTKFNATGQWQWNKIIAGSNNSVLNLLDLAVNATGEVFFTGKLYGNAYFENPNWFLVAGNSSGGEFLAKLNNNGVCDWAYATSGIVSSGTGIDLDASSNIYLTGTFTGTKDFDYQSGIAEIESFPLTSVNLFVASYNDQGVYRWGGRINTSGTPLIDYGSNGRIWVNSDFNSSTDLDIGPAISNINTTNATEFISTYSSNGIFRAGFALKGSASTGERVTAISAMNNGNVLVAGVFSGSIDLDRTANSYILTSSLDSNAYIASYNHSGGLNWANHIKGMACIKAIKSTPSGDFYVTGYFSGSTIFDFNNAPGTFYQMPGGGAADLFVIKYNATGVLQWIHRFGAVNRDEGRFLEIDQNGNIVVGGIFTTLIDFDPDPSADFNLTTPQSITSCFIAKYDANGDFVTALKIVATSLTGLTTDNNNNIIATGTMRSFGNFNISGGNYIIYCNGGSFDDDNFVAKYDSAGTFQWAFGLGNSAVSSVPSCVKTDDAGNIYFAGYFGSFNDSLDLDPSPTSSFIIMGDGVLAKYSPSGAFLWGMNTAIKSFSSIAVDANGNPSVAAEFLHNVDIDPSPASLIPSAGFDSFILLRYSLVGQYLDHRLYSTSGNAYTLLPTCIALNDSNNLFVGGYYNGNVDFDAMAGPQNLLFNSGLQTDYNGFLLSLDQSSYLAQIPPAAAFMTNTTNFCEGTCISFQDNSLLNPNNWFWSFPGANPATSTAQNPGNICYSTPGVYDVQLIVANALGSDTLIMSNFIQVDSLPNVNAGSDVTVCEGSSLQLSGSGANAYSWSPSASLVNPNTANPIASPSATTTYTLTGSNGTCSLTDAVTVVVQPNPSTPLISPAGSDLQSTPAYAYQWYYNGTPIVGATFQTIFPTQVGNYSVTVFDTLGCFATSSSYFVTTVGLQNAGNLPVEFVLQPNPVQEVLQLYSSINKSSVEFKLYDLKGSLLKSVISPLQAGPNTLSMEVSDLAPGVYRLEIGNGGHSIKFLKQ